MRKLMILAMMLFATITCNSKEYVVESNLEWTYFNQTLSNTYSKTARLSYDVELEYWTLYFSNYGQCALKFKDVNAILSSIDKYKEWNKIASSKHIKLNKKIMDLEDVNSVWWTSGRDWEYSYDKIYSKFVSMTDNIHYMLLLGNVTSSSSKYIREDINIIFTYQQIIKLEKVLRNHEILKQNAIKTSKEEELFK